jgi:hypothetical protein
MNFVGQNYPVAVAVVVILLLILVISAGLLKKRPKGLNQDYFQNRWQELQTLCKSKNTWPLAIINADTLLDEALKKRHVKGKAMGERLVTAQRILTDNDSVWYGHKLRNRLVHEDNIKLKEKDVKQALLGFRQALKDLGAF